MSNMRQIARLAGVSLATVSMALRDLPQITPPTREKVKEIARKLNYALPHQRTVEGSVIGYIIHDQFGVLATDILRGAMEEAGKHKFGVMFTQVRQSKRWIEETINDLLDAGIRGLVLEHSYAGLLPRRILLSLRSRNVHVVQIMNKVFADTIDTVCRNEMEYARTAAEHLAALGHRRVLLFDALQWETSVPAFQAHNMEVALLTPASGATGVQRAFEEYLRMSPRPTAIITNTDDDAFRLYHLVRLYGWRIPADLSILGMGNMLEDYLYPDITTIDIQPMEMGRTGVRLLAERMAAALPPHEITEYHDIALPAHIIDRGSTGPPNTVE